MKSCVAGAYATSPTCGWAIDSNGRNIYNSQGFCCACTLSQVAASTLSSGSLTGKG